MMQHPNPTYQRLLEAAMSGFLTHGYHGYTLEACAESADMQPAHLAYYIADKLDLAQRVMQQLHRTAQQTIESQQWPFTLRNGAYLAVLPTRLWVANDAQLQSQIRCYYTDWYLAFVHQAFDSRLMDDDPLHPPGHRDFLRWLGFWMTEQMVLYERGDE